MNMMRPEHHEQQITKTDDHQVQATHRLQEQYHQMMQHGGKEVTNPASKVANEGKNLMQEAKSAVDSAAHLDIPQLWNHAVKQVESGVGAAAKQAWDGMDKDPTAHWIKHDLCNDNPVTVGIAAVGAVGIGALAVAVAAPEAAAAAAVSAGLGAGDGMTIASIGGVTGALTGVGLKLNWDNHHPAQ